MLMPMVGMRNPFSNHGTVEALAILVDMASGMVDHVRRGPDEWTVSSELSPDLSPDGAMGALEDSDALVLAESRPPWPQRQQRAFPFAHSRLGAQSSATERYGRVSSRATGSR